MKFEILQPKSGADEKNCLDFGRGFNDRQTMEIAMQR
jgi:hypothetical protein